MLKYLSLWALRIVYIMTDLATAWFLAKTAERYIAEQVRKTASFQNVWDAHFKPKILFD